MKFRIWFLLALGGIAGWYALAYRSGSEKGSSVSGDSGKIAPGVSSHSPGFSFTPIKPMQPSPGPSGSNPDDQRRLERLVNAIENNGEPKREQGIVELRAFLNNTDPQVRLDTATMLYTMKDRSGFTTLLEILRSPDPVLGRGGIDLRYLAANAFARYREKWAGEAVMRQYEKTRGLELIAPALSLRVEGIVPYLQESLEERSWFDSIEGLAVLEPKKNDSFFKEIADNDQKIPKERAAAIFGLAMSGDEAALERLIAVATNPKEALPGNQDDLWAAKLHAATYLTNFRGDRIIKVFEDMLTWKQKELSPSIALIYLRYRYPENRPSREIIKAGLQPGGAALGWDYSLLLKLARLSGDPELLALGHKTDYFTSFRELDVRAGWSNAWIGENLPDWEGDWPN